MIATNLLLRRALSTQKADIGQIFFQDNIQRILKDISRFKEEKIFARRPVPVIESSKFVFMTDEQLAKAKEDSYERAKASLQMPPVLAANTSPPAILAKDEDIVGYTKFKVLFIDISSGGTNRQRLMSVRETDGTLREPTHDERSRLNHMFYPSKSATIDPPKLFEEEQLQKLLRKKQYKFILDRACVQFEPDDPRYVDITTRVYKHINDRGEYDKLRSTRHFGPMSLYLAYSKQADDLIIEMLSKGFIEDAAKLVQVYNTCHNIE